MVIVTYGAHGVDNLDIVFLVIFFYILTMFKTVIGDIFKKTLATHNSFQNKVFLDFNKLMFTYF